MTWAEYRRKTESELRGRRVVTLVAIRNRYATLPIATHGTIQRKWKGLEIDFDACEKCGIKPTISRVNPTTILLLPRKED